MFTGLIEEIGTIKSIMPAANSSRIKIEAKKVLEGTKLGDSISTNGVCLTVTEIGNSYFTVDVMPETMRKSNLSSLKPGNRVNLERALRLGDRLGGHIVSGHIDGVGIIKSFDKEDIATWVTIEADSDLLRYVIYKGSIAIDGISLTVAFVDDRSFKVSIIPHTKSETTLLDKNVGDVVNLECDVVGKYIEKLMYPKEGEQSKKAIDMSFLAENGFV